MCTFGYKHIYLSYAIVYLLNRVLMAYPDTSINGNNVRKYLLESDFLTS